MPMQRCHDMIKMWEQSMDPIAVVAVCCSLEMWHVMTWLIRSRLHVNCYHKSYHLEMEYCNRTKHHDPLKGRSHWWPSGYRRRLSDMKCTVMIWRSWVQTPVGSNLGCVVLLCQVVLELNIKAYHCLLFWVCKYGLLSLTNDLLITMLHCSPEMYHVVPVMAWLSWPLPFSLLL